MRVLSVASATRRPTSVLPVPQAMINWPRSEAVRTLRRLGDARNAFPIHTRSDRLLEAFCDLGVDFAATDWRFGDEGGLALSSSAEGSNARVRAGALTGYVPPPPRLTRLRQGHR